ncbi:hypothetical protein P12x_003832 [Tundrisphaera lichenicola]|uniref:hypothetical protein n=1 Tax=Tundrisphaera lichenicola TaxID=2029860 RepID=UPI003EB7D74F
MHPPRYSRPGLLTFIGIVSLIWSSVTLIGSVGAVLALLLVGAGSWLLGPLAGAVGTFVVVLAVLWLTASSFLSILLFLAGWKTIHDDPGGIHLHRLWAWISLALDAVALLASVGTAPNSWTGIAYAIGVLYVTSRPDVLAYYGFYPGTKPTGSGYGHDDLA